MLGPDGRRLAKRHGAVTLDDRRERGESAADVLTWMAVSAGLIEPGEPATPEALVDGFDAARLHAAPTRLEPGGALLAGA